MKDIDKFKVLMAAVMHLTNEEVDVIENYHFHPVMQELFPRHIDNAIGCVFYLNHLYN